MNIDITALKALESEKNIPFEALIETISTALLTAYRHVDGHQPHARIDLDRKTGIVRVMAEETGADAFVRQQTAIMNRVDSRPGLAQIRCPVLVVVGADDTLMPPDRAAEMAAAIPDAQQVVVPACGHLSTIEQPEAVTRALVDFLHEG